MQLYIDKSMLHLEVDCAILWDQVYCNLATVVGLHGESRQVCYYKGQVHLLKQYAAYMHISLNCNYFSYKTQISYLPSNWSKCCTGHKLDIGNQSNSLSGNVNWCTAPVLVACKNYDESKESSVLIKVSTTGLLCNVIILTTSKIGVLCQCYVVSKAVLVKPCNCAEAC